MKEGLRVVDCDLHITEPATTSTVPSAVAVLGDLTRQLDDLDQLEEALSALLPHLVPNHLGKWGRRGAIDLIELSDHARDQMRQTTHSDR